MRQFIVLMVILLASPSYGKGTSIRCNKKQTLCEIQNKRITIGDKIGIFSEDNFLVAIGMVVKIKGSLRVIKMMKRFGRTLRTHRAVIISDREAKKPSKYFKVMRAVDSSYVGALFDFYSMGIGDGFVSSGLRAQYHRRWQKFTYFLLSAGYISGSGQASAKLLDISQTSLDLSVFSVSGGLVEVFRPYDLMSFRGSIEGGFGISSVELGTEGEVADILNNRIIDGTVMMIRGEVSVSYRWKEYQPMAGLSFLRLHNSNNMGFVFGVLREL